MCRKQQCKPHTGMSPLEARLDYLNASSYTNKHSVRQQTTIISTVLEINQSLFDASGFIQNRQCHFDTWITTLIAMC